MTLVEKSITTQRRCPKNHKIRKVFQFEDGIPGSYYFYCETCRKQYEESKLTRSAAQKKEERDKAKRISIAINPKISNKVEGIVRKYENEPLTIIVPKSGHVPRMCLFCSAATIGFTYEVKDGVKKAKQLFGKECPECQRKYFGADIYVAHSKYFALVGDESSNKEIKKELISNTESVKSEIISDRNGSDGNELLGIDDEMPIFQDESNATKHDRKEYTDDFGNEYDFSELSHLLNL